MAHDDIENDPPAAHGPRGADPQGDPEAGRQGRPEKMRPRAHARMPMVRAICVFELDDRLSPSLPIEAQSVDLSRGGMCFCTRRLFHVGRSLLIEIPKGNLRVPTFLYGLVRYTRYVPGQGHTVGVELEPLPEIPSLMEWVAKRIRAAA